MKQAIILLGLSALSLTAMAQQQTGAIAGDYRVSAFANSERLQPLKRADAGTRDKIAAQFPGWYMETDKWTGGFKELNGTPIAISGSSLEAKARYCMDNQLAGVGVNSAEWKLTGQLTDKKGNTHLYFVQQIDGHTVVFAKMNFKFTADQKLGRVSMRGYGAADTKLSPSISKADVLTAATADLTSVTINGKSVDDEWSWFPIPSVKGYTLRPAYSFHVQAYNPNDPKATPLDLSGYVDAISGEMLYRDNEARDIVDLKIKGTVYKDGKLLPTSDEPLKDLQVTINADPTTLYYTDTSGYVFGPGAGLPDTMNVSLKGRYCTVFAITSGSVTPAFSNVVTALGTDYIFPVATPSSSRHVNAYYHVNRVHDFMKDHLTSAFTAMDSPLPTNVDVSGTCNAFYMASSYSINFYAAGGGCTSFAEIGDIIYHEYGHGISDKFYTFSGVPSMRNGAMNEGNSDIWAISITGNPILGQGSYTTSGGGLIRRYDIDPKVYPKDIVGEVHADGEIIAGAWWDVSVNTASVELMGNLFTSTYYDTPDGPNGTEGDVYHQVLLAALTEDDDDGNLKNGTPHFAEIIRAFAKHGIYFLSDIVVAHNELGNQPAKKAITVNAKVTLAVPDFFFQGLLLTYKVRGASTWDSVSMANVGSDSFTVDIPAKDAGTIIDYYITVQDVLSTNGVYFPANYYPTVAASQTTLPYQFGVGIKSVNKQDFEGTLTDWQLGLSTDNATTGKWVQAVPVPSRTSAATGSILCQTGNDHTTGTGQCLVTGNAATTTANVSSACVKNGTTTVNSPIFNVSGYTTPVVEYYRWFGNDLGNFRRKDNWEVRISDSDGVFWSSVDNSYQSDYNWRKRIFAVSEYLGTSPTIQLRFIAKNIVTSTTGNAVVEAAVDDMVLYDKDDIMAINDVNKQLANIYPNPANDYVTVVLPSGYKTGAIEFYDISGKLMSTVPVSASTTTYHIGTQQLVAGQYMMVVKMDKTIQTHSLTIVHP